MFWEGFVCQVPGVVLSMVIGEYHWCFSMAKPDARGMWKGKRGYYVALCYGLYPDGNEEPLTDIFKDWGQGTALK